MVFMNDLCAAYSERKRFEVQTCVTQGCMHPAIPFSHSASPTIPHPHPLRHENSQRRITPWHTVGISSDRAKYLDGLGYANNLVVTAC